MRKEDKEEGVVLVPLTEVASIRWSKERGQRLEELRGELTQEKVAQHLRQQGIRMSRQYVQRLEASTGVRGVSPQILQGLCNALGVTLPELLGAKSLQILHFED